MAVCYVCTGTRRQIVAPVRNLEDVPIRWVEQLPSLLHFWYPKRLLIISSDDFVYNFVPDKSHRANHQSFSRERDPLLYLEKLEKLSS